MHNYKQCVYNNTDSPDYNLGCPPVNPHLRRNCLKMNTNSIKNNGRQDRRVNRTRRQLREALTALILEKGYDAITIEDITDRADLGRTTFYLHYRGKEELLLESIGTTAQELYDQVTTLFDAGLPPTPQMGSSAIAFIFQQVAQNSILYRIILKGGAASRVQHFILDFLSEAARPYFEQTYLVENQAVIPLEVLTNYFSAALIGFLNWWLETDMPYPADQAAGYFEAMFFTGMRNLRRSDANEN